MHRVARATADLHVGLSELDVEAGDLDERPARTSRPPPRSVERGRDDREPLPVVRGQGPARRRRRRPGRRPSTAWTRRSSSTARASSPTCGPSRRCGPGSGSRRAALAEAADWARDARRVRRGRGHATCASSTTSPWCGCCSREHRAHPDPRRVDDGARPAGPAARRGRRRPGAPAACSRSACCRPSRTTRRATGRRRCESLTEPGRWRPNPRATSGSSWTRAPPMVELLRAPSAERRGRPPRAPRARRLGEPDRDAEPPSPAPGRRAAGRALSERELQVLRLLDSELSGPADRPRSCSSRPTRCAPTPSTSSPSSASPAAGRRSAAPASAACSRRPPADGSHPAGHIVG